MTALSAMIDRHGLRWSVIMAMPFGEYTYRQIEATAIVVLCTRGHTRDIK